MDRPDPHQDCRPENNCWQQVTCDRCRRTYTCNPRNDYYCTGDGTPDHCCQSCLLLGTGVVTTVTVVGGHEAPASSTNA